MLAVFLVVVLLLLLVTQGLRCPKRKEIGRVLVAPLNGYRLQERLTGRLDWTTSLLVYVVRGG